ncbi:Hsp20/alpha crystallin family protein [Alkalicoccus halolimnae]|uniref:Hsp20/alpha crystallin family protein n=1 Tax=Alkalicoccus halolimnae TaxID=1667239 RepID=A0A5C7F4G8_9BACI|nr:Hsp20/alpha crystallin family protein [Alkalicoccus halolimnae]TXF85551.1 Hsp20/alpha crystallin family protein [Alkalicoccus halolimnae]
MKMRLPRKRDSFFPSLFDRGLEADYVDRFFGEIYFPQVDVKEKENHYVLDVDLPGYTKEDVTVEYADGYLEIRGEREKSSHIEEGDGRFIRKERSYGSFRRHFFIGEIDKNEISGSFNNGVLTLQVPKSKEDEKKENGHRINIE